MISFNPIHFSNEIAYNLQLMETTLKSGGSVDFGFIDIFTNDIKTLSASSIDNKVTTGLTDRLQSVAGRIENRKLFPNTNQSVEKKKLEDVQVPVMRNQTQFSELVKGYSESDTKRGLEYLDSQFSYYPIKGDGHCLFRSIAAGVLFQVEQNGQNEKEHIIDALINTMGPLGSKSELETGLDVFLRALDDVATKKCTSLDIMNRQPDSDHLVKFMRYLAVEYNRVHGNEVFEGQANDFSGSQSSYNCDMVDMNRREHGGNAELLSLANAMDMKIQLLHPEAFGKNNLEIEHLGFGPESNSKIWLLYRPGHYDLLNVFFYFGRF